MANALGNFDTSPINSIASTSSANQRQPNITQPIHAINSMSSRIDQRIGSNNNLRRQALRQAQSYITAIERLEDTMEQYGLNNSTIDDIKKMLKDTIGNAAQDFATGQLLSEKNIEQAVKDLETRATTKQGISNANELKGIIEVMKGSLGVVSDLRGTKSSGLRHTLLDALDDTGIGSVPLLGGIAKGAVEVGAGLMENLGLNRAYKTDKEWLRDINKLIEQDTKQLEALQGKATRLEKANERLETNRKDLISQEQRAIDAEDEAIRRAMSRQGGNTRDDVLARELLQSPDGFTAKRRSQLIRQGQYGKIGV